MEEPEECSESSSCVEGLRFRVLNRRFGSEATDMGREAGPDAIGRGGGEHVFDDVMDVGEDSDSEGEA